MTNRYQPVSIYGKATYGEDSVELDLSPSEEQDALSSKHLELVPRRYRVLSDNYTAAPQGQTFEGAYLVENEAALIAGGHIQRVDEPSSSKEVPAAGADDKPAAKAADKKEK